MRQVILSMKDYIFADAVAGALRGDEKGDLSLSDDLMRAIIINKRYTESRGCCNGK